MSKRAAQGQGGEDRYGGQPEREDAADIPRQATAAQLAKRKIAQAKGSRRPRSESPLPGTGGSIFDQATQSGFLAANNNNMTNPTNPFGSTPSFSFGNNASANGSTQSFGSGGGSFAFGGAAQPPTQQSTPNTNSSFTFGAAPASSSFQFRQSPAPQSNGMSSTGFSFGQQNGDTPKISSNSIFGDQTPKPASNSMFGDQTPKAANPFGSTATNGTSGFTFGQQKPAESQAPSTSTFGGFNSTQASTAQPASDGWSSFLNKPAETPKPATNGFTPSNTSIFAQTNGNTAQTNGTPSVFAGFNQSQATPSFKFTAQPDDNDASMMSPENTPQKQNTGMFSGHEAAKETPAVEPPAFQTGKGSNLFDRISKEPSREASPGLFGGSLTPAAPAASLFSPKPAQPAAAPATSSFAPKSVEPVAASAPSLFASKPAASVSTWSVAQEASPAKPFEAAPSSTPTAQRQTSMNTTKEEHFADIRELNEGLVRHLKTQDLSKDLSTIFEYYQYEIKKIQSKGNTQSAVSNAPATTPGAKPTSGFGNSILGKPAASSQNPTPGLFGAASSTAPAVQQPEPSYPNLPENASATSKLFQAALDEPQASKPLFAPKTNGFTPSTTSLFSPKPAEASTTPASNSLFAAKASETSKPAGFTPSFTPATTGGSSFLSSFGQQAAQNAEKEKKRRRDEDFDSEEENAEEWEKRDAEEQAAKRAKLEEAAKASASFKITPANGTPAPSMFSGFGKPAEKPATSTATEGEDHTWKQGTPIKFGGVTASTTPAAAPKFNMFGAASTPASSNGASLFSAQKPVFSFGQPSNTPVQATSTTNAEADDGEDGDAAPPEPQLDDMAVLLQSEKDESDVLYHVEKSKSRKLETRPTVAGNEVPTWIDKGHGPIWLLRNKASGRTRVLQKIKDSGRLAMNFSILAGDESMYKAEGVAGKSVMATFIDHIGDKQAKKPSKWLISFGKKEDAEAFTRILREEQKKA